MPAALYFSRYIELNNFIFFAPFEDLQNYLQAVVDGFRHGQLARNQAELQLALTLQHGCTHYGWVYDDQYLAPYSQQLDQHELIMAEAQNRGAGLQGQHPPNPGAATANAGNPALTLEGHLAPGATIGPNLNSGERGRTNGEHGERRRRRIYSSSSGDSSSESKSRERRGKKPRLDTTRMGFDPGSEGPKLDPYRRQIADILENYKVLRRVQSRGDSPQFTEAGWKAILAGEFVDFGAVAEEIFGYKVDTSDRWHQV
ncbi:hypothetical protein R3P38DRAFT_3228775 [Favolaschia claudopus]|uniref:Uncharacterized protein n=1 Tax=Favolaschia claudopus TaxID=2862362 RepID=A0AAV9ZPJ2_9AGAR